MHVNSHVAFPQTPPKKPMLTRAHGACFSYACFYVTQSRSPEALLACIRVHSCTQLHTDVSVCTAASWSALLHSKEYWESV